MSTQVAERSLELFRLADLVTPFALRAAATLRVADHVAAGARTVPELAQVTGCHPRPLGKLVAHLSALGVLRETAPGTFEVAELGAPLLAEHDHLGTRAMLDLEHVLGRAEVSIAELLHTLRTARPAFERAHGRDFWQDIDAGPGVPGLEAVTNAPARFDAGLVVGAFDWDNVVTFVDVGGNGGAMVAALLRAHDHLRATLVDLPAIAQSAEKNLAEAGLADRCQVAAGNFFDPLPNGADVYLLSAILADWDDDDAVAILRRCAEAAGHTGVVLVAEVHMVPSNPDPVRRTADALRLEASMTHPDRTVDDLVELGRRAGLDLDWRGPASPVRSLLAFRAASSEAGDRA